MPSASDTHPHLKPFRKQRLHVAHRGFVTRIVAVIADVDSVRQLSYLARLLRVSAVPIPATALKKPADAREMTSI